LSSVFKRRRRRWSLFTTSSLPGPRPPFVNVLFGSIFYTGFALIIPCWPVVSRLVRLSPFGAITEFFHGTSSLQPSTLDPRRHEKKDSSRIGFVPPLLPSSAALSPTPPPPRHHMQAIRWLLFFFFFPGVSCCVKDLSPCASLPRRASDVALVPQLASFLLRPVLIPRFGPSSSVLFETAQPLCPSDDDSSLRFSFSFFFPFSIGADLPWHRFFYFVFSVLYFFPCGLVHPPSLEISSSHSLWSLFFFSLPTLSRLVYF